MAQVFLELRFAPVYRRRMKDYKTPGQLISDLLDKRGWTKRALAVVLEKDESTINKIVSGKGAVTTETALALEDLFGTPAETFLDLQKKYDLAVARIVTKPDLGRATRAAIFGDLPVAAMCKRGWLGTDDPQDVPRVEAGLKAFFGVKNLDEIVALPHAAKKTDADSPPTYSQIAWFHRVQVIAHELLVPKYSPAALKAAIRKLHALTVAPEEVRNAARILAECGVRLVIVESLPSAKIDGVCFWLDEHSPVVGLSLRHDRIDNFWFVLRHELEHVLQGHGLQAFVLDSELEGEKAGAGPNVPEEERIANTAAQDFCVPKSKMDAFVSRKAPLFSESDLLAFAKMLRVHPGIVAGQLQHRTGRYDRFRQHLKSIRVHLGSTVAIDGWGDIYPLGA